MEGWKQMINWRLKTNDEWKVENKLYIEGWKLMMNERLKTIDVLKVKNKW